MKSKFLILSLIFSTVATTTSFSFAFSLYKRKPNDISISIKKAEDVKHTITYHLPSGSDNEFNTATISVKEGTKLYDALLDKTGAIDGFAFNQWHASKDHFRTDDASYDPINNNTTVMNDIEVFAKYTKENILYYWHTKDETDFYLDQSCTDYGLNAHEVYYGTQIYSVRGVQGIGVELTSQTGIYNFTKRSSDWDIKRKITFSLESAPDWWFNDSALSQIYTWKTDQDNTWLTNLGLSKNNRVVTVELDPAYIGFIFVRENPAYPGGGWEGKWNQSNNAEIKSTGSDTYSSSTPKLKLNNNATDISWTA